MRFGQWLFVSMCLCACLGAAQAKMATDILKERAVSMMPLKQLPVSIPALTTPDEQLAAAVEAYVKMHGRPLTYVALIQAAARVKHDDEHVIERLSEWERREG